ncbi:TIGR03435 family protein [Terriglobus sp. RCC_193]|uniref:TIGR03435 family protein n=1 Tax=Terriglobus sp. RCC_193 TaxID=3239218 RepID=UPI0035235028
MRYFSAFTLSVIACIGIMPMLNAQSILEVSAVKPHPENAPCGESRVLGGGHVEIACFTLELMIREGFNVLPFQVTGGPQWVRHDMWDIVAKDNNAAGKRDDDVYREVLLAVARESFSLKLHTEKRRAKGFALTVATAGTLGPRLTPASGQPYLFEMKPGPSVIAHGITMSEFAEWLKWPAGAGRVVEDRTGLSGRYDVTLRWTPLRTDQMKDPSTDNDGPVIFTALREQLGLKLVTTQVEQDNYEIQSAERPGSN